MNWKMEETRMLDDGREKGKKRLEDGIAGHWRKEDGKN